eukprot:gene6335-biopygen5407
MFCKNHPTVRLHPHRRLGAVGRPERERHAKRAGGAPRGGLGERDVIVAEVAAGGDRAGEVGKPADDGVVAVPHGPVGIRQPGAPSDLDFDLRIECDSDLRLCTRLAGGVLLLFSG